MPLNSKILNVLFLILPVFAVSFLWYTPILFKGYHPDVINDQIVLARNLADSGKFSLYNDHGVIISSDLVKEKGEVSSIGNKFTAYLYAEIFKKFGVLRFDEIVLVSVILNALTLLIFSFTVFYLFNIKAAVVFSFVYALFPFYWRNIYFLGNYEFSVLFLAFFFLFFLLGKEKKHEWIYFIFAGIFLSLALLTKEAFMLMTPALFFYLILEKKKGGDKRNWLENIKSAAFLFFPILIILSVFYLPNFLKGENIYRSQLFSKAPQKKFDFSLAGHLFPDYYTFRFDREDFFRKSEIENSGLKSIYFKKAASNTGEAKIGILERAIVGATLFMGHISRFVSLEEIGGPIVFILIILGALYLKKEKKFLFRFFIFQIAWAVFLLSFVLFAGRGHLADFAFALGVFFALGILYITEIFSKYFNFSFLKEKIFFSLIFTAVLYHLFLVNHIAWGKAYDKEKDISKLYAFSNEIEEKNINSGDVIATGLRQDENLTLNFLSNKSVIVFRPETLKKLSQNGKIKDVFNEFNIKYILGYDNVLSEEIEKETGAKNIFLSGKENKNLENSQLKTWIMGIIR